MLNPKISLNSPPTKLLVPHPAPMSMLWRYAANKSMTAISMIIKRLDMISLASDFRSHFNRNTNRKLAIISKNKDHEGGLAGNISPIAG